MAIYGRFGDEVELVRRGTLEDVRALDRRKPDKMDRENVQNRGYVVVRDKDQGGKERLAHLAYLRADGGFVEIAGEMRRLGFPP